jgi:hypothetical protein
VRSETDLRVTEDDDGIRPAGRRDECFYCHRKVGEVHKETCVMLHQEVECELMLHNDARDKFVFRAIEPASWTQHDIEFFFNESSSCLDNVIRRIRHEDYERFMALYAQIPEGQCLCFRASVRLLRVIDPGPFRLARPKMYQRPRSEAADDERRARKWS